MSELAHGGEGRTRDVEVLLATLNGERFLREQIESILAQSYERVRILARDDGSRDGTGAILAEYAGRYSERFRVLESGEPSGSAKGNFLRLMSAATGEYVCFADQDDVWLPEKVGLSVRAMEELESRRGAQLPLLVFSDLRVVDDDLRTLHASMWRGARLNPRNVHRLERLVGLNVVTGCTMMINGTMLALGRRMPEAAIMHDRWLSLLAAAMGGAEAISTPTVLYRQHDANVIGAPAEDRTVRGTLGRAKVSESRRRERWLSEQQAEALLEVYGGEIALPKRELLRAYLRSGRSRSRLVRVWTTLRFGFFRGGLVRDAATLFDAALRRSDENVSF